MYTHKNKKNKKCFTNSIPKFWNISHYSELQTVIYQTKNKNDFFLKTQLNTRSVSTLS